MKKSFLLAMLLIATVFSYKVSAIDVTYISQTRYITPYWANTYAAANAAAKDLDINLTIIEGQGHRIYQAEVITQLVASGKKPDLLIFHAYKQNIKHSFNLLEQAKIPFITYSNFTGDASLPRQEQLGLPQETYKYWLAEHSVENSRGAGLLVKSLINQASSVSTNNTENLKVLALSGDLILESIERSDGVSAQVKKANNATLVQDIIANWSGEDAKNKFKSLYARHKGIDIVWASSDVMALGALAGAIELGLEPNKNIFIGGFDWDKEAINALKQKQLTASAGGQFYNIAWLLVQVYDHLHNIAPFGPNNIRVDDKYTIIEQSNLTLYAPLTELKILETVNFYCFTKKYTRQSTYDFSMVNLLKHANDVNKEKCK